MELQRHEYGIGLLPTKSGFDHSIVIAKTALEMWREHYMKIATEGGDARWPRDFYLGKADALDEILEHFEED